MSDNIGDFTIGLDVSEFTNAMNRAEGSADDLTASLDKTKSVLEYLENQQEDTADAFRQDLSAEYEDLQTKIEDTKSHIEELKEQQAQFSDEDIDSSEYDELTAQIESATAELEGLQAQADAVNGQLSDLDSTAGTLGADLDDVGKSASDTGSKMGDADDKSMGLGDAFSKASSHAGMLGGAIGGLVSGGLSGLIDFAAQAIEKVIEMMMAFDEANSTLVEKTGASGEALDEFNRIAAETAIALDGLDVAGAAGVVGELNTRLDLTGEELETATVLIGKFADVTGTNAEGAVASVSKVMKNWGVEAENMESLLDKMTIAGHKTGISADALASDLVTYKVQLKEMGFGLDESIALLSNFEKEGINSSRVMMGFNTAIAKWSKEGKDAKQGFEDITTSIKNATNETDAMALATEYFGTRAGAELVYAVRSGRLEFDDLSEAIENSNGVLLDTEERAQTFSENMERVEDTVAAMTAEGGLIGIMVDAANNTGAFGTALHDAAQEAFGLKDAEQAVVDQDPALEEAQAKEAERLQKQAELEKLAAGGYETMSRNMDGIEAKIQELNEQYEENYDTAYNNINGSIGLFDDMTIKSGKSVNKMIDSLKSQVKYMDNYSSNMKRAAELGIDQGLLAKLSDGSEESAAILQSIVDDGGEHIEELNTELAKVEEGKKSFSDTYATMVTDFDTKMGQIETRLGLAVDSMNQYAEAYDNGSDTVKGFIKGSQSHYTEIYNAYKKVAEQANRAVKTTLQIKSPSKVMMQLGEYTTEGFAEGALSEMDKVQNAFAKIVSPPMPDISSTVAPQSNSNIVVNVPIQVTRQMTDADITRKADMITSIVSKKFAEATGGSLS